MTLLEALHRLMPMNLTSLSFYYLYLPLCLLAYYLLPSSGYRQASLLAASLGFIALSNRDVLPVLLICAAIDAGLVKAMALAAGKMCRSVLFWVCVAKNLALIGYFGVSAQLGGLPPPFGLFVLSLSGISAALHFYRKENPLAPTALRFANDILFFPQLYAGPISGHKSFLKENLNPDADGILTGFGRLAGGAFKYSVLGGGLFQFYRSVRLIPEGDSSVLSAWSLVASAALSLYFTFSGLSEIARGIAGLFGIHLPQNFYYPYQSRSVTDFFERFNMSLTHFLKKSVYEPLDTGKDDAVADCLNLLLIGMLWGLWFGIRPNHAAWGALIAFFMILEKYFYKNILDRAPTLFCRCYALFIILPGFAVFVGESLLESRRIFLDLFHISGVPAVTGGILYLLSSNWLLIASSLFFSTSAVSLLTAFIKKIWPRRASLLFAGLDFLILLLFTAFSLGGAQN